MNGVIRTIKFKNMIASRACRSLILVGDELIKIKWINLSKICLVSILHGLVHMGI